ncbi:stage II sporulation protein P [Metallumcola ferriviriculae]|uniref:Stage II sporulation protein P n=1 Tax=Metallumcola ferriviriculae TaxID=3039180 RepID=A0AAU0UNT2_9FIRM|nr:stage II sporulation protein P [Desulfitibacteraceae bacterium MK1]
MNKGMRLGVALAMVLLGILVIGGQQVYQTALNPEIDLPIVGLFEGERNDGGYFTVVDEKGKVISKTSRVVYPEDELITEDNKLYRIERVSGDTAHAKFVKDVEMPTLADEVSPVNSDVVPTQGQKQTSTKNLVGIYQTHNDESYVPTDGTESIAGKGGIVDVGKDFSQKLKNIGVNTEWSSAGHLPHDQNAYKRSRRTAFKLLKQQPAALIDVHRDGVPDPDFYRSQVSGEPVTKLRLVVGRQNPHMQANLDFAKRLKATSDKIHPGLIKEIFMAKGNYNQDLTPKSILIEAGTHTNTKKRAMNGVELFADVVPQVLGINTNPDKAGPGPTNAGTSTNNPPSTPGDWTSLLWVIGALLIGGGIFLLVSTGSWEESWKRVKNFGAGEEWANFLGRTKRDKPDKPGKKGNMLQSRINEKAFRIEEVEEKLTDTNDERAEYQKD